MPSLNSISDHHSPAVSALRRQHASATQVWTDAAANQFERQVMDPLDAEIRRYEQALQELQTALSAALSILGQ